MAHEAGKGDTARPLTITPAEYGSRWEMTFGKKKSPKPSIICPKCGADRTEVPCPNPTGNLLDCGLAATAYSAEND